MHSLPAIYRRLISVVSLVSVASFRRLSFVVSSLSRYPNMLFLLLGFMNSEWSREQGF